MINLTIIIQPNEKYKKKNKKNNKIFPSSDFIN